LGKTLNAVSPSMGLAVYPLLWLGLTQHMQTEPRASAENFPEEGQW